MRRDALTVSVALLLGCGVGVWAEESADRPATTAASAREAAEARADSIAVIEQQVAQLFELIEDRILAARQGPTGSIRIEKMRQIGRRIKALAAEDVIRRKVAQALQARLYASDEMVDEWTDRVIDSWAQILSYYLGQWQLEKMVPILDRASGTCTVLVPVLGADQRDKTTVQVQLIRSAEGQWKVERVSFADLSVLAALQSRGAVERSPAPDVEER